MTTERLIATAWDLPVLLLLAAIGGAAAAAGRRIRRGWFAAGLAVVGLALASPIQALASGSLFTAHMVQHLLLLMGAPAFFLLSLGRGGGGGGAASGGRKATGASPPRIVACWACGMGAMVVWHVPALCDAAVALPAVHFLQIASLLLLGAAYWLPLLSPRPSDRLPAFAAVGYLFASCLCCTALGIVLTLTPIRVCPVFERATAAGGLLALVRHGWGLDAETDREAGGLVMWLPMCLVYLGAILGKLHLWFGSRETAAEAAR